MENSEKDAVIRRIIEIAHLKPKIAELKQKRNIHVKAFVKSNGIGDEITGAGKPELIAELNSKIRLLELDYNNTKDIRIFFEFS